MEGVFIEQVQQAKDAGKAVLLSSHILSEVEKLCDTVTIVRSGRTVESGTIGELRHLTRTSVDAVVTRAPDALATAAGVYDFTASTNGGGTRVAFSVDNAAIDSVFTTLARFGVHSLTAAPPSLEELFMRHYGDVLAGLDGREHGRAVTR
jgi:ABC-2 type transport system ATP-binding protein